MTTVSTIRSWITKGLRKKATHVIVMCDTYDHDDYPVYVYEGENPREKAPVGNMQRILECYSLKLPIEAQLTEQRAHHWEIES